MRIVFDRLKFEAANFWIVQVDGRTVFLSKSYCSLDEEEKTADVPDWLAYKEGLEGYEV